MDEKDVTSPVKIGQMENTCLMEKISTCHDYGVASGLDVRMNNHPENNASSPVLDSCQSDGFRAKKGRGR